MEHESNKFIVIIIRMRDIKEIHMVNIIYIVLTTLLVLKYIIEVFIPNNKLSKKIYEYKLNRHKKRFHIIKVHNEKDYEKRVKEHNIMLMFVFPIACFIIIHFKGDLALLSMLFVCIICFYFENIEKDILKNDKGTLL